MTGSEAPSNGSFFDEEEIERFIRDGYLVARGVFARETAAELAAIVWDLLDESPDDPSTWTQANVQIERVLEVTAADGLFTSRYRASVDALVGPAAWTTRRGFGWVIVRFPGHHRRAWRPPRNGWHVDGMDFRHRLDSPEQGLVGIEILSDIGPHGGGTVVDVGSHRRIARRLHDAGRSGLSYSELLRVAAERSGGPLREVRANAGDVVWMHPFLVHARGPNTSTVPRLAANRQISLRAPMRLINGPEEGYSAVEWAILAAVR
ncbi:MAG: phytanoyl-CoA dioxygenase family protein [bacterium]|nr:phytanoyl-CoA dioxygenase family protein [bacterium]